MRRPYRKPAVYLWHDKLEGGGALIQVYTGNGKGKTTAALGLAIRAAGAGMRVCVIQFAKGRHYCELMALKKIRNIKLEQYGRRCFIRKKPGKTDIALACLGWKKAAGIINKHKFDMLILDELNIALKYGVLSKEEVFRQIKIAPKRMEIVITGRYAPKELMRLADLVSQVKEVKHYYKKGLPARRGIEF